jgi:hypothetical protein
VKLVRTSEVGCKADLGAGKADMADLMSSFGGKADVLDHPAERLGLAVSAISGHSVGIDAGLMLINALGVATNQIAWCRSKKSRQYLPQTFRGAEVANEIKACSSVGERCNAFPALEAVGRFRGAHSYDAGGAGVR